MDDLSFNIDAIKMMSRRSSSIFNVDTLLPTDAGSNKKPKTEYQQQLQNELNDWYDLVKNGQEKLKRLKETSKPIIPLNVLSNDQITYCINGPNFSQHIQDVTEFSSEAALFLKSITDHFEWVSYLDEAIANKFKDMARDVIADIDT